MEYIIAYKMYALCNPLVVFYCVLYYAFVWIVNPCRRRFTLGMEAAFPVFILKCRENVTLGYCFMSGLSVGFIRCGGCCFVVRLPDLCGESCAPSFAWQLYIFPCIRRLIDEKDIFCLHCYLRTLWNLKYIL